MGGTRIAADYDVAVDARAELGEGPRWDALTEELLWVDILGRRVHRYDPARGRDDWMHLEELVSVAIPHGRGGPLLGLPDGFYETDWETLARVIPLEPDLPGNRTNDAACDPAGRLFAGTMPLNEREPLGALYRIDPDLTVTKVLAGTTIANGLGWSPARDRFYFIDSPTMRVDVFDYDLGTGSVEERRPFTHVRIDERAERSAGPDGLAVDAQGCVWVALHGGWGLQRYSPEGEFMGHLRLPVSRVTSCCFGGRDLRDLYVTTRREGLSHAEQADQPLAGALFRVDAGVAGLPTYPFGG